MRWLGIALVGVVLLILAPVVYLAVVGLDAFKPRIVAAIAAATGRELTIAGPIGLKLSLVPTLRINDATLSNPPGFSRPEMARLHRLDLQIALLPLLGRRIEVDQVVLTGPDILLETNAAGQSNWQFQRQTPPANAADPTSPPAVRTEILVRRIEIDNGQVAFRNAAGALRSVQMRKLTMVADTSESPVALDAAAEIAGTALTLKATGGSLSSLTGGAEKPFPIDMTATAQGATISLKGVVADIGRMSGADLTLAASVPDLAALSAVAGANLPGFRNLTLQSRVTSSPSSVALAGLKLAMPETDIDGDVALTLTPRVSIRGKLHAGKIDVDALQAASTHAGTTAPSSAPAPAAAPVTAPPRQKIFSDAELPLGALLVLDADLNLAIDQWLKGGMVLRDIVGHLTLQAGKLRLDPFVLTAPGGVIHLALNLDAGANPPPLGLVLRAPSLAMQPLLTAMHLPAFAQGQMEMLADFHGAGRSPHAIAVTLNGNLGLASENARIDPAQLGELLHQKELLQLGGTLTAMRCLAVRTEARNGVADVTTLLLDTVPLRLTGGGAVNLGAETLALRLLTTARLGGTGVVAPVEVGGTLLAPSFGVGKMEALAAAAQVLGQTGVARNNPQFGLIIGQLGLDRLVPGTGKPEETCERALALARGTTPPAVTAPAAPASSTPSAAAPKTGEKTPKPADILRQLLR